MRAKRCPRQIFFEAKRLKCAAVDDACLAMEIHPCSRHRRLADENALFWPPKEGAGLRVAPLVPFPTPETVVQVPLRGWRLFGSRIASFQSLAAPFGADSVDRLAFARPVSCASPPDHPLKDGDEGPGAGLGFAQDVPAWASARNRFRFRTRADEAPAPNPCRELKTSRPSPFFSVSTRPHEGLKAAAALGATGAPRSATRTTIARLSDFLKAIVAKN